MTARPRGRCPLCGYTFAVRRDGRMYRHYGDFISGVNKDGSCPGWGLPAKRESEGAGAAAQG